MFKYIFLIIIILVMIPQVRRFVFWLVVGKQMVKEQKRHNKQTEAKTYKKNGEINVDYVPKENGKNDFKGGQYVDYEEVKE